MRAYLFIPFQPAMRKRSLQFRRAAPVPCAILLCLAPGCFAADDPALHTCTVNAGGAWTQLEGSDRQNFPSGWKNFQAGVGFAVTPVSLREGRWSVFVTADFLFDGMKFRNGVLNTAQVNPTNLGLISATGGRASFYSTTLDLNVRSAPVKGVSFYAIGGFGWLRRDLVFTGASNEGSLLQPTGPAVFESNGNSGAFDGGAGVQWRMPGARGLMVYLEGRAIHGLAVNHGTTLVPISVGVRW